MLRSEAAINTFFLRTTMCRSIKTLRSLERQATPEEVHAAALQFVRKISGYRQPSKANTEAFDAAVAEITATSERLLGSLTSGKQFRSPSLSF